MHTLYVDAGELSQFFSDFLFINVPNTSLTCTTFLNDIMYIIGSAEDIG